MTGPVWTQEDVGALVDAIVERAHPLRIILFGSAARGTASFESDIDLLVVMPNGTHRRDTARMLYRTIRDITVPFDLVVATEDDLARYGDTVGYVYREALEEGRELYAA